jgi:hypothetical protein
MTRYRLSFKSDYLIHNRSWATYIECEEPELSGHLNDLLQDLFDGHINDIRIQLLSGGVKKNEL